jgi:hypothetical protein
MVFPGSPWSGGGSRKPAERHSPYFWPLLRQKWQKLNAMDFSFFFPDAFALDFSPANLDFSLFLVFCH